MKKLLTIIILLPVSLLFIPNQFVYSDEVKTVSLVSLIGEALKNNPQILSAQKRYAALQARIPQSFSLEDPTLEFGYDKMLPRMTGMDSPMRTYGVSQEFPFPTKLFLRRKMAVQDAKISFENYKEQEKSLIQQVKSLYAELFLIYRSIEINQENKALLEQLAKSAANRFSLGQVTQQDALKAQVELAKIDNELIILEQKRQVTQAKLNILRNRSPDEELGSPVVKEKSKLNLAQDELYKIAKENRPELAGYRYAVDKSKSAYSLSKQEYLPDFMMKYERQVTHGDTGPWRGMLGVTFPLWFWEKQNYNVKEMRAELEMQEAEYKTVENLILFEVKDAFSRIESLNKLISLYETSFLPQTEQALKSSLTGYESNRIDFLNLLDSQRMLLEIKLDYYRSLVDVQIAEADLERAVGKDVFVER